MVPNIEDRFEFPKWLKIMMEKHHLSAYRLSQLVECNQATVCIWLKGKSYPRPYMIERLKEVDKMDHVSTLFYNGRDSRVLLPSQVKERMELVLIRHGMLRKMECNYTNVRQLLDQLYDCYTK